MRTITATMLAALLLTGTVGCSASDKPSPTPTSTVTKTARATATVDAVAACTDAIVAGRDSSAPECADLSPDDVFKAVQDANKRGQDALASAIASASAADR